MTPERQLERLLAAERSARPDPARQQSAWRRLEASLGAGVPPLDVPLDGAAGLLSSPAACGKAATWLGAAKQALMPLAKSLAGLPVAAKMAGWFAAGAVVASAAMLTTHQLGEGATSNVSVSSRPRPIARGPALGTVNPSGEARSTTTSAAQAPGPKAATRKPTSPKPTSPKPTSPKPTSPKPTSPKRATPEPAAPRVAGKTTSPAAPAFGAPRGPVHAEPFDRELELIRKAKVEFDAGRATAARAWLAEHATRYPQGVFAAEREGLSVLIECRQASSDARHAATAFLANYPGSPMAERIRNACGLR